MPDPYEILDNLDPADVKATLNLAEVDAIILRLEKQLVGWNTLRNLAIRAESESHPQPNIAACLAQIGKNPIDKRKSPPREAVVDRIERILLYLNQQGASTVASLSHALGVPRDSCDYAVRQAPTFRWRLKYTAARVSKLWGDEDKAMFGDPQVATRDVGFGETSKHQKPEPARAAVALPMPEPAPSPPAEPEISRRRPSTLEQLGERCLLYLNREGPSRLSDVAGSLDTSPSQSKRAMTAMPTYRYGIKYAAGRVSKLWTHEDEQRYGIPHVANTNVSEPDPQEPDADEPNRGPTSWGKNTERAIPEADDGPKVYEQRSENWVRSAAFPMYGSCDLCDDVFNNQLICVLTDYMGTKAMCYGCARKAGCSAPPPACKVTRAEHEARLVG